MTGRLAVRRFRPVTWLAIGFVKVWRLVISPMYGNVCKYKPSCSAYGLRALQVHGVLRATPLIVWRILRCNPWSNGGYDPVPGTPEADEWAERQAERVRDVASSRSGVCGPEGGASTDSCAVSASLRVDEDAQLDEMTTAEGRHRPEASGPHTVPGSHDPDDSADNTATMNHSRAGRSGKYLRDGGLPSLAGYTR